MALFFEKFVLANNDQQQFELNITNEVRRFILR